MSEPERMSRRASLISSTLGWRLVLLRIQAASSRAWACERPACVTWMRSRRASARVARGGSKRRATSSRQPVSFDQERSVTLRLGSRASSPGSEWRPERSPVESTTTRLANDQHALTSGSQRSGSRRSSRNTGRSGRSRLAMRLGSAAPSSPAARVTSSQRSSPAPLGEGVVTTSAAASSSRAPCAASAMIARDGRLPGSCSSRRAMRSASRGSSASTTRSSSCVRASPRSPPRSSARRSSTAAMALTAAATCVRRAPAGRRPRRGPSCLRRTGAERRPRSARRAARDRRRARRPSRRRCG